ncbi:SWIM zinc finger family protein [Streptomyces sp. NPDC102462]|uniref:SWIM zinc finger family protein n=1 Tax=Streptomyces sp. NPDC102462 TaxID=3366178 RepID=UPI0038083A57
MTADRERPADIARRALRAARERSGDGAPQRTAASKAGEEPRGTAAEEAGTLSPGTAGEEVGTLSRGTARGVASGAARTPSRAVPSEAARAPSRAAPGDAADGPARGSGTRAVERRPRGAAAKATEDVPRGAAFGAGEAPHGTDGEGAPPARRPRPGDAARAAIRPAVSADPAGRGDRRADEGDATSGTAAGQDDLDGTSGAAAGQDDSDATSGTAARRDGPGSAFVTAARRDGLGGPRSGTDAVPDAAPSPAGEATPDTERPAGSHARSAGRPADAARHALRAARREPRGAGGPPRTSAPPPAAHPAPTPSSDPATEHTGTPTDQGTRTGPPRLPRTMASPHRDGELRRTFPAFPGRTPSDGTDAPFAATWWGQAWIEALERGALDAKRLARGRGYAEQGHVDAITVTPGLVLAYVRGSRPRPYRVQVRLRTFDEADWERFLDAAADRPGRIAALLDRQLPVSLAEAGAALLPGAADLDPRCSCPDSGHPCKHAAALCYQTARLLDADPFVLLLLRGRGERQLLDALSRRSATAAARAAQDRQPRPLPGVRAAEALAARELPPLPAPLSPPAHPGQPPVYPAAPGGPDPFVLDQLATDAAARAHALLSTGRDTVGELTLWQDAVRLAAARPGSGLTAAARALYSALAAAAGRTPAELARAVAAWRQGGRDGLATLEEPWDPPAGRFDRARPLLLAAGLPAFRPWCNHLTHPRGQVQLRLGRDGLWYAYEAEPGHDDWWPRGTPATDPISALTGLDILDTN